MYKYGVGVDQDYSMSVKWYRKAAEQGYTDAQYEMGLSHVLGLGSLLDFEEAYFWLLLASASGNVDAVELRNEISNVLSMTQMERIRNRAKRWMEEH